jgi:hypothetical protein
VAQLLADPLLTVRNWLSLRRLKQLAEARVATR